MRRTHYCGSLDTEQVGQEVCLCGWVHGRRDHGKLIFVDLRDREGITQLVINPAVSPGVRESTDKLGPECVIAVRGEVVRRPKGTENPKLSTGQVEIAVKDLQILNSSRIPPFEIQDEVEINEELRLAYRYLDLRRPHMQKNLYLRHKVFKIIRDILDEEGFWEVETPILTKSTPEGARDYLVPSRLNPGQFYALPQSPQLFKQLLMVSGVDRYFQIARCFRDEDLRKDRQPEFTQLDIEMSFMDENEIFRVAEKILQEVIRKTLGVSLELPLLKMSYQDAMNRYGTDKPDLRQEKGNDNFPFCCLWVTDFPLFHWSAEEKRWDSEHHPFTAPHPDDLLFLNKDPGKIRSRAYDLVINGVEVASGSIRIHQPELQSEIFKIIGLSEEETKSRFGFLLEAFSLGAPPHGGIALGMDRFLVLLANLSSIREVIAFPKTQKAQCLMSRAPSEVSERQLKELRLKISL